MAGLKVVIENVHNEILVDRVELDEKQVTVRDEDNNIVGYVYSTQNLFMIKSNGIFLFEGLALPSLKALILFGNKHLSLNFYIE